jgi:hypothetical protein
MRLESGSGRERIFLVLFVAHARKRPIHLKGQAPTISFRCLKFSGYIGMICSNSISSSAFSTRA